jgi:hypothetical protein
MKNDPTGQTKQTKQTRETKRTRMTVTSLSQSNKTLFWGCGFVHARHWLATKNEPHRLCWTGAFVLRPPPTFEGPPSNESCEFWEQVLQVWACVQPEK